MIPPLTEEEFRRLVPPWAQELRGQGCPLAEGLPVYCVLYGPKYGGDHRARGVVHKVSRDGGGCSVNCREHEKCWGTSGLSAYYVPDMETEEGKLHVEKWKRGEIPPFPPYKRIHPPMSIEGLDSIGALAVDLFIGDEPPDSVMPLERLDELYEVEGTERQKDFKSVDIAIEFVDSCLSARRFDHLQAGWRYVDLTRVVSAAAILSLTTSSHLVRPKTLLPERQQFIERCRDEFRRREFPEERINNLLKGLSWE